MKTKISIIISFLIFGFLIGCTDLEEVWHNKVVPETFFKSNTDIKSALYRPFTHASWFLSYDRWFLQENTADQFTITTKGEHWYDGGEHERYHSHAWTPNDYSIWETWRGTLMGVALALDTKQDLEKLDYTKFALTQADKDADINSLNTLIAFFYLKGLDYFGGLPIFTSLEGNNPKRNTDQEVFSHVENLLKVALPKLQAQRAEQNLEGELKQAAAATMLAQLYFNANAYIGKEMFTECATICKDIIDKKYGDYDLDNDWFGPFDFYNNQSPEVIWSIPSEFNKLEYSWFNDFFYHYNTAIYFNIDAGSENGVHLTPSRKPDSTLYMSADFKLGSPYEKFDNGDLRKAPYKYKGGGVYEGMFLVGDQISPINGDICVGSQEYKDLLVRFVDQVARFSEVGPDKKYASVSELPSKISEGEENSGIRLVKVPIPSTADKGLRWGADNAVIRLAEVYYMLAECKMRAGDKDGAATLINKVRERNFPNRVDPNPVTAANLDEYRMLDEWGMEFLGEGRRRTDLIRWNKFVTEAWWDHTPSNKAYLNRYPVPHEAISGNNNLQQNPGYN